MSFYKNLESIVTTSTAGANDFGMGFLGKVRIVKALIDFSYPNKRSSFGSQARLIGAKPSQTTGLQNPFPT